MHLEPVNTPTTTPTTTGQDGRPFSIGVDWMDTLLNGWYQLEVIKETRDLFNSQARQDLNRQQVELDYRSNSTIRRPGTFFDVRGNQQGLNLSFAPVLLIGAVGLAAYLILR